MTRAAARRLVRCEPARAGLGRMLPGGGRVVALGDSLTAGDRSWAEILKRALQLLPATRGTDLVNLGVPGDTTVHVLSRLDEVVAVEPQLVIALVGTNDARRHGTRGRSMLMSDRETERSLRALVRLVREEAGARVVLVTPPPVLEARIARAPVLIEERVSWREADVARKAARVAAAHDATIDSRAFLTPPLEPLLLPDGLHLSPRGQELLATTIARWFAA